MKPSVGRTWGNLYSIAAGLKCKSWGLGLSLIAAMCSFPLSGVAQSFAAGVAASTTAVSPVPQFVNYVGALADLNGKPLTGVTGVTFLLYKDSQGGAPLWMETQNVQPDKIGHYSVMLGSTTSQGLPQDVFVSGDARWLGVQVVGEQEQPRVLLVAVPYALKAGDAETIGGLPASAFALANGTKGTTGNANARTSSPLAPAASSATANPTVTGKGVVNFIPIWDTNRDIIDSLIFQKSSHVGLGTTSPAATLDVNGKSDMRDTLTLFPKGTDPTLAVNGTTFKIDQTGKVTFATAQKFPGAGTITGVTTASGSGLTGGGTSGALNLGLVKTCSAKQILQWNGSSWACSSAGSGTITDVNTASGSGLQGGGTSGTLNLSINSAVVPQLARANTFTNTNKVNVNSGTPALTLQNAAGDGLDIYPGTGSDGVYIPRNAGQYGIVAYGGSIDGGYFNGPVAGSYSVNVTDGNGSAAAYGQELGSTKITYGVVGFSASKIGIGTYGQAASASTEGTLLNPLSRGVWGDTGAINGVGLLGTVDDGFSVLGINNSGAYSTALFENEENIDPGYPVLETLGGNYPGVCEIDVSGNLFCNGTKSAVVPVDGGTRKVALYAVESPENWFEDFGSGQLSNGAISIALEPTFRQTVNTDADYHVFLTPNGDSRGLYVTQKTATSFEVREQGGGKSSVAFDYRIVARRKGYEQIRLADKTREMNAPRPRRRVGTPVVMPTQLEVRNQQEAHLHSPRSAPLVAKRK